MNQDIIDEIEKRISERGKIITSYKLHFERVISISEAYEASLRKIPVLIETADIANTRQKEFLGASYLGVSIEAHYIAQKEVDHQIDNGKKLINEGEQITIKINDLIAELNKGDREFLTLIENSIGTKSQHFDQHVKTGG